MCHRIILVRMTLATAQRQPQPKCARCADSVDHIVDPRFFRIATSFAIRHVVAVKASRQPLFWSRIWQQISGELLDSELIKRQVAVERADHPISPRPVRPGRVPLKSIRIGIASCIQPPHRQPLTKMLRCEKLIDKPIVGLRRLVIQKRFDVGGRWRQPRQIKRNSPHQCVSGGANRRGEPFLQQPRKDERINRMSGDSGGLNLNRSLERPVFAPRGSSFDPAS